MKKILLFSLIFFKTLHSEGQLPWYQYFERSCWAASLAFVAGKVGEPSKNQCYFINKRYPRISCKDCSMSDSEISSIRLNDMRRLTSSNISIYNCYTESTMGLGLIKKQVVDRKKPIIYNYKFDSDNSHIVVIDDIEYTHLLPIRNNSSVQSGKEQTAFFRIKDSWPKCEGNEYFSTYERYYIQVTVCDNPKYTIYTSSPSSYECEKIALTLSDKAYLNNILKSAKPETLITKFLNNTKNRISMGTNRLSSDFFEITNLPQLRIGSVSVGPTFNIRNVGVDSFLDGMDASITISTLLNFDYEDKIVCLNLDTLIITSVTVSKTQKCHSNRIFSVRFDDKQWILHQIENGNKYNEFLIELSKYKDTNYKIIDGKEGVIIRFADANFILFTIESKYHVYDLYGNGFNNLGIKVQLNKIIDFDEFLALAKIYKPQ